jgi:hypothetical protein
MNLIGSKHIGFKKQEITEVWLNRYQVDRFTVKTMTMPSIVIVFSRSLKDETEK